MKPEGELVGVGWRIVFFRAADRIAHRVELAAERGEGPVLESVEGSPDQPWPASPALQQVHFQPGANGRQLALLVGMAGRSHWSSSVELSGDGSQATFEVACRAKSPPEWLGTSYRVLGQHAVEHCAPRVSVGPIALIGEPLPPAPPPQWTIGQGLVRLTVLPPAAAWPQTIAWRYVLQARR